MNRRRNRRCGATLIDVALGSMLLTVLLIPAIQLVGESQSSQRRLVNREIMLYEAEQLLEASLVSLAEPANFSTAYTLGVDRVRPITVSDGPDLVGRLRIVADTTMPIAALVTIVATVWRDTDSDGLFDTDEQGETLRTQWSAP